MSNYQHHAGIDFVDTDLVRFLSVKSPEELAGFCSTVDEFNDYVGPELAFDLDRDITRAYAIKIAGHVAGYFDLALAHLRNDTTTEIAQKEISSNIPALLISHFAVDSVFEGHCVGRAMMDCIMAEHVPKLKKIAGCRYLILRPRDDDGVRAFYKSLGFKYIGMDEYDRVSDTRDELFIFDLIHV